MHCVGLLSFSTHSHTARRLVRFGYTCMHWGASTHDGATDRQDKLSFSNSLTTRKRALADASSLELHQVRVLALVQCELGSQVLCGDLVQLGCDRLVN